MAAALTHTHTQTGEDSSLLTLFLHCQLSVLLSSSKHPVFYLHSDSSSLFLTRSSPPSTLPFAHTTNPQLPPRQYSGSHHPDFTGSFKETVPPCDSFRSGWCFLSAAPIAEQFKSCQSLIEASALTSSSVLVCPFNKEFELIQSDFNSVVPPPPCSVGPQ